MYGSVREKVEVEREKDKERERAAHDKASHLYSCIE